MKDAAALHEVLDRAFVISEMWSQFIERHPTVLANSELAALAQSIGVSLGEFYQAVGMSAQA